MMSRIPIIKVPTKKKHLFLVCNWKMYPKTLKEARALIALLSVAAKRLAHVTIVVCPPALFLPLFSLRSQRVRFGAQSIDGDVVGSKTGEISGAQVASVGGEYTLVGHAERRARGETDYDVGAKVFTALSVGLTPIVCVGESKRDARGEYIDVLKEQVRSALAPVPNHLRSKVLIAYEPVYAIGAAHPPSVSEIHHALLVIKKVLHDEYGASIGRVVPLLYGGAVDARSVREIALSIPELSGFLVGRASVHREALQALLTALQ